MIKKMEKEKNIMIMENYNLKENIIITSNILAKNFGILKSEGKYLNNKIFDGKYYNSKGILEYELKKGNGYVKEYYDNDKLKYEGEYINGYLIGKGKNYYENGNLKTEGDYILKNKMNMKGYKENGDIDFEVINGKGYMKNYYDDKLLFEGEILNGERNGKGKEYDNEGNI